MFSGGSLAWKRVWGLLSLALLVANSVLAIFPVSAASAGGEVQSGVRSLPPGVVTYSFTEPSAVSSVVDDRTIDPYLNETGLQYMFVTTFGNYSFDRTRPYVMTFTYGSLLSRSAFLINASRPLHPSHPVVTQVNDTFFECRYAALSKGSPAGTVTFTAEFSREERPKLSVAFSGNETFGDLNIVWGVATPASFLRMERDKTLRLGSNNMSAVPLASRKAHIGTSSDPSSWDLWLTVDWEDAPSGRLYEASFNWPELFPGSGVVISFPANLSCVDPTIVASDGGEWATYVSPERKVVYDGDYYWVFYHIGTTTNGRIRYATSVDGVSWSTPTYVPTDPIVSEGFDVKLWGGHFYLAYWCWGWKNPSTNVWKQYTKFIKGSINGSTVVWGPQRTIVECSGMYGTDVLWHVSVAVDSNGVPAVAGSFSASIPALYIATDSNGTSWSTRKDLEASGSAYRVGVVATGSNSYYAVYTYNSKLKGARVVSGNVISEGEIGLLSSASNEHSEAVDSSGNIRVVYAGSESSLRYSKRAAGGTSWSTPAEIKSTTSLTSLTLTLGLLYRLNALYIDGGILKYTHSSDGSTWSPSTTPFGSSLNNPAFVSSPENATTLATIPLTWTEGTASPHNVMFGYLAMPTGSSGTPSSDPWNRPGLSPYQEYFKQLAEYVSPGSGLLTIKQTDLYLPGRELDLAITRVFTTPLAFLNGDSPYNLEIYPWANLGSGWQLNFPWIGKTYLHLWDGQQYPMNWTNNIYENHRGQHFKLVKHANGSYTLYTGPGTRYIFDSEKRLTDIVDRTGNNRIEFSYSGSKIAQITDTIGRTVILSYDSDGRLASVQSGQRTIQYGYLDNKLVSVTDPAGRTTQYKYDTGTSNWLVNGTIYPTGGHTSYTYGSSPIGVNLVTYLVTLQNQYSSSDVLSNSRSFNYTLKDGEVTNSKVAQAGADPSIQAYTYYEFSSTSQSNNRTTLDGNKVQLNKLITFYDQYGAAVQEDVYRGNATTKSYSNHYGYDGWGNLLYLKDAKEHEAFWAYARSSIPWLSGWNYRKRFDVTGQPGAGTNYQIKIVVHRTSGTDSGKDVYLGTKCRSDFGDIRFTKADRETLMDYWMESKTDSEAVFWVEVSEDLSSDKSLYIYYDPSIDRSTTSNGPATFLFFDHFNNLDHWTDVALSGWTCSDSCAVSPGTTAPHSLLKSDFDALENMNVEAIFQYTAFGTYREFHMHPSAKDMNDRWFTRLIWRWGHWEVEWCKTIGGASSEGDINTNPGSYTTGVWYRYREKCKGDQVEVFINDVSKGAVTEADRWGTISNSKVGIGSCNALLRVDWIFVRKYAATEPSISQWGSEEQSTGFVRPDGTKPDFTSAFYDNLVEENIHGLLVGEAESQNGSKNIEAYYKRDFVGNLLEEKALHNGGWLYTKHTYDIYGNRLSTTDANNHSTQYTYSPTYQHAYLTKVGNILGESNVTKSYGYDLSTGDLLTETDPNGHTTTYQYDVLGRLTSVTYPPVGGVSASKTYAYDDINNILTRTNENGHVVKQYYDGLGRLTKIERYNGSQAYSTETYSYNWLDKVENHTTTTGSLYTYDYDALGRLINASNPDGTYSYTLYDDAGFTTTSIDENGHNKTYGYDELGPLIWAKEYPQPTSPHTTSYTYDQVGNLLKIIEGQSTSGPWLSGWKYRKKCNITGQSGAGTNYQVKTTVHYGSGSDSGSDVYCSSKCKADFGDIRFTANDAKTQLDYWIEKKTDNDKATFWVEVSADLSSSQSIYLYYGKNDTTTTSSGPNTFIFFDDFSGDLSKWTAGNSGLATPSIVGGELKLTGTGSGGNYWWSWGYAYTGTVATGGDNFKVHAKAKMPSGSIGYECWLGIRKSNTDAVMVSKYRYSPSAQWQAEDGLCTNLNHGRDGISGIHVTDKTQTWVESWSDLALFHDASANQVKAYDDSTLLNTLSKDYGTNNLSIYCGGNVRQSGNTITAHWDNVFVRKCLATEPSVSSWSSEEVVGEGQVTTYEYDDLNRLVKTAYSDGSIESLTYDNVGNLISRLDPKGNSIAYSYDALNRLTKTTYPNGSTITYTYDGAGNRLTMKDPSSETYYRYNERNWLTNETKVIDGTRYSKLYTSDKLGNILTLTYPDSFQLTYTYDALDRLKTAGSYAAFTYTLDDKVYTVRYGNGVQTTYSYDVRSRPMRILTKFNSLTLLDLNYTYDGEGNVLSINTETYWYDTLDRLTSSSGPWGSISYTYDAVGNRLTKTEGGTINYEYGACNRLTQAGSATYSYDANGNLATKNDGTNSWTYSYDYENRLTQVKKNGQTIAQYVYDSGGQRIKKTEGAVTEVHIYQGLDIIYQRFTGNDTTTKRIYGAGRQVAEIQGGGVRYLHQDFLGSTRVVSDPSGVVRFSSSYKPFGPSHGESGHETHKYTGKPQDSATALYYFGARYYDPEIGRFITQDPGTARLTEPQTLNRYVYSVNNPLRYVDPNGAEHLAPGDIKDFLEWNKEYGENVVPSEWRPYVYGGLIALEVGIMAAPFAYAAAAAAAPAIKGALAAGGGWLAERAVAAKDWIVEKAHNAWNALKGWFTGSKAQVTANREAGLEFQEAVGDMYGLKPNVGPDRVVAEWGGKSYIADYMDPLAEAKNVQYLYMNRQLQIAYQYAKTTATQFTIYVPEYTKIAGTVGQHIKSGIFHLVRVPY